MRKIKNLINKRRYKKYCDGKIGFLFIVNPDHFADCVDLGETRRVKFMSGKYYYGKIVQKERCIDCHDLFLGTYLMTVSIQELTLDEFCNIYKYRIVKLNKDGKMKWYDEISV